MSIAPASDSAAPAAGHPFGGKRPQRLPCVTLALVVLTLVWAAEARAQPTSFPSQSPDSILSMLVRIPALEPRSEFETTTQFEARRQRQREGLSAQGVRIGDEFTIVESVHPGNARYDADTETYTVLVLPDALQRTHTVGWHLSTGQPFKALSWRRQGTGLVAWPERYELALYFENDHARALNEPSCSVFELATYRTDAFRVPISEAPSLKANFSVAYRFRLRPNAEQEVEVYGNPAEKRISAKLRQMEVFDRRDGRTLSTILVGDAIAPQGMNEADAPAGVTVPPALISSAWITTDRLAAGQRSRVSVRLRVGAGGVVETACVERSQDARVNEHVLEAVRAWRFTPARSGILLVPAWTTINTTVYPPN